MSTEITTSNWRILRDQLLEACGELENSDQAAQRRAEVVIGAIFRSTSPDAVLVVNRFREAAVFQTTTAWRRYCLLLKRIPDHKANERLLEILRLKSRHPQLEKNQLACDLLSLLQNYPESFDLAKSAAEKHLRKNSSEDCILALRYYTFLFRDPYNRHKEIQNGWIAPLIGKAKELLTSNEPQNVSLAYSFFSVLIENGTDQQRTLITPSVVQIWERLAEQNGQSSLFGRLVAKLERTLKGSENEHQRISPFDA